MNRIGQGLILGVWIVGIGGGVGQAATGDDAGQRLAEVKQKASQVESYRADFTLTVTEADKPTTLSGTILYQQPDKRRIEFTNVPATEDVAQLVVSDGTTEWQYFPARKVANQTSWAKLKAAGASPDALEVRGLHQPFVDVKPDTIRLVETKTEGNQPLYVFEAEPAPLLMAEAPFAPGKLRIAVAAADGLTRWLTMTDASGREVLTQQYSKVQTKVSTNPEQFTFTPPPGVQVVDISEERARAATAAPAETPATPAGERP